MTWKRYTTRRISSPLSLLTDHHSPPSQVWDWRNFAEHVRLLRRRLLLRDPEPADQTRRGLGRTHPRGWSLRRLLPLISASVKTLRLVKSQQLSWLCVKAWAACSSAKRCEFERLSRRPLKTNRWWNTWLQILMLHNGLRFVCLFVYSCYKSSMQCELSHIAPVCRFLLLGSMPSFLILLFHLMTISNSQSKKKLFAAIIYHHSQPHPILLSSPNVLYCIESFCSAF